MKVSELKTGMDARFEAVDREFTDLRSEMRAGFAEARRHTDVVAEELCGQIATVLEVVVQTNKTVERMASEQQTLVAALGNHEVRIQAIERRRR